VLNAAYANGKVGLLIVHLPTARLTLACDAFLSPLRAKLVEVVVWQFFLASGASVLNRFHVAKIAAVVGALGKFCILSIVIFPK
jgi:hypothetical protein